MTTHRLIVTMLLFCILLSLIAVPGSAQNEARHWYFGSTIGLVFGPGGPTVVSDGAMDASEGCAVVSDSKTGDLLFYTDGSTIWNREHRQMPNGSGLLGSSGASQSALIVPHPGEPALYYVFTVAQASDKVSSFRPGLWYSVVDMRRDNGRGDVVEKNVHLRDSVGEKITGTLRADSSGFWIVAYDLYTTDFYAYTVTAQGLNSSPVVSRAGPPCKRGNDYVFGGCYNVGYHKISPNGKKIAVAGYESLFLADFDAASGRVDNAAVLDDKNGYYAVGFSPDNTFLYATGWSDVTSVLVQYRADFTDNRTSVETLARIADFVAPPAMQLGPDRKIYLTGDFQDAVSVIHKPNCPGSLCDFRESEIPTGENPTRASMPNFMDYVFDMPRTEECSLPLADFTVTDVCAGACATVANWSSEDSKEWTWSFPGGTPDSYSGATPPPVCYSEPGVYTITLMVRNAAGISEKRRQVRIHAVPVVEAGSDRSVCAGTSVQLEAQGNGGVYRWQPEEFLDDPTSPTPTATVPETTKFTVTATSENGCEARDSVTVVVGVVPDVEAGAEQPAVCTGESVRLWAQGATAYQWSPAEGLDDPTSPTPTAQPTATTVYRVYGRIGDCVDSADVTVEVIVPNLTVATPAAAVCPGDRVRLDVGGMQRYEWIPAEGLDDPTSPTPTAQPKATTVYRVYGWIGDCVDSADITVTVYSPAPLTLEATTAAICRGDRVRLGAGGVQQYEWSPADGLDDPTSPTPTAGPVKTTVYTVRGIDANGCGSTEATVTVVVYEPTAVTLTVDTVRASPGEIVELPVWVENDSGGRVEDFAATVELRFDRTQMEFFEDGNTTVRKQGQMGIVRTTVHRAVVDGRSTAAVLRCMPLLASERETPLELSATDATGGCLATVRTIDGRAFIGEVCVGYGVQRFTRLQIAASPVPARDDLLVTVAAEPDQMLALDVFDLYGRRVMVREWMQHTPSAQIALDMRSMNDGVFLLVVRTPHERVSQIVRVAR